ncbi:MAG: chain-length determining protein [Nitratireductor sp.]|nr:chain-length determining protein [Nitratireductor sp.]
MSGARSLSADVDIDIKGLLSSVWRKRFLLLLVTLVGGALLFAALSAISPRYKSDAQILIKKRESVFTRIQTNEFQQNGGEFDEQAVKSQVLVLNSDDLAAQVIKKLNLENHAEFQASSGKGLLSLATSLLSSPEDNSPVAGAPDSGFNVSPKVLKKFKEQLLVYVAEKSRVIIVEFWARDKRLARDVPNTLANLYLETTRNATLETDSSATEWLGPEIEELRQKVSQAEAKVAEFRSQSDILLGNNNALLATQQLSEVSSELSRVRAERTGAEARIDTIRTALANGGSLDVIPEVISSPLIQRLRERQVTTQAEISELSTTLLPNHPRIKALRSQMPEIENQIRKAARDILTSLENNVERSRKQEEVLLQEVNRFKSESARVGEAEVQLRALEREAAAQRERLEGYLVRFNEAESRQNSGYAASEAKIIEHAVLPANHYFPKVVPFTLAGMTALVVLGVISVLTFELLSGRAFKPVAPIREEDYPVRAEPQTAAPVAPPVSAVPVANAATAPPLVPGEGDLMQDALVPPRSREAANDTDAFAPEFALQALENMGSAMIAVANPSGRSDNRALVSEIARHLSASGKSVVVADFSGNGATALKMLGSLPQAGFFDVLAGRAPLRDVLFIDEASGAHVLASGRNEAGVEMGNLGQMAEALSASYDFAIFDCGDAGMAGVSRIAGNETVVLIPVAEESMEKGRQTEREFKAAGFSEAIMLRDQQAVAAAHVA